MSDHVARYMKKHNNVKPTPKQLQTFTKKQKDLPNLTFKEAKDLIKAYKAPKEPKEPKEPKTAPNKEDKEPKHKKKPSKEKILYEINDQILLTQDRMGIVKYVGEIEGLIENTIYYGVELVNGVVGKSDGTCKGKRYFQTDGNRAIFVKSSEIRRKMTERDHKRQRSYDLTKQIKEEIERKITPKLLPVMGNEINNELNLDLIKSQEEIDIKEPENEEKTEENEEKLEDNESNNGNNSDEPQVEEPKLSESNSNDIEDPEKENDNETPTDNNNNTLAPTSIANTTKQVSLLENTVVYNEKFSKINDNENIIEYIFKQTELLRLELLDIYANPSLNPLIEATFNKLKKIDNQKKQNMIWEALIYRWKKYL